MTEGPIKKQKLQVEKNLQALISIVFSSTHWTGGLPVHDKELLIKCTNDKLTYNIALTQISNTDIKFKISRSESDSLLLQTEIKAHNAHIAQLQTRLDSAVHDLAEFNSKITDNEYFEQVVEANKGLTFATLLRDKECLKLEIDKLNKDTISMLCDIKTDIYTGVINVGKRYCVNDLIIYAHTDFITDGFLHETVTQQKKIQRSMATDVKILDPFDKRDDTYGRIRWLPEVGQGVGVNWKRRGILYKAIIMTVNPDETYNVKYNSDDEIETVSPAQIRFLYEPAEI